MIGKIGRLLRERMVGATLLVCLVIPIIASGQTGNWLVPAGGSWETGANWSTNPLYPNGVTYTANLPAFGAPYTVI